MNKEKYYMISSTQKTVNLSEKEEIMRNKTVDLTNLVEDCQMSNDEIKAIFTNIFGADFDLSKLKNNKTAKKFLKYIEKNKT